MKARKLACLDNPLILSSSRRHKCVNCSHLFARLLYLRYLPVWHRLVGGNWVCHFRRMLQKVNSFWEAIAATFVSRLFITYIQLQIIRWNVRLYGRFVLLWNSKIESVNVRSSDEFQTFQQLRQEPSAFALQCFGLVNASYTVKLAWYVLKKFDVTFLQALSRTMKETKYVFFCAIGFFFKKSVPVKKSSTDI